MGQIASGLSQYMGRQDENGANLRQDRMKQSQSLNREDKTKELE